MDVAVIKINHMKSGDQLKSCVRLNVKMSIFASCQQK